RAAFAFVGPFVPSTWELGRPLHPPGRPPLGVQSSAAPASRYDFKQDRWITGDRGQVLANSDVDVACRVGGDEPPRERVRFSHFSFTATREIGMAPEIIRQVPRDHRFEAEERRCEQM